MEVYIVAFIAVFVVGAILLRAIYLLWRNYGKGMLVLGGIGIAGVGLWIFFSYVGLGIGLIVILLALIL